MSLVLLPLLCICAVFFWHLTVTGDLFVGTVAALSFGIAFAQYRYAATWKRHEFALELIEQIRRDEELRVACEMLDWAQCELPIPSRYAALYGNSVFKHDAAFMDSALRGEGAAAHADPTRYFIYRECMDALLAYLSRINEFVQDSTLLAADVLYLRYWCVLVVNPPYFSRRDTIRRFIELYEYVGAADLINRIVKVDGDVPFEWKFRKAAWRDPNTGCGLPSTPES